MQGRKSQKKDVGSISIRELYSTLVAGAGISPDYVLDRMQWYEVETLLEGYDLRQRDGWEKVRTLAVASLQSNSAKRLKAQKVFPLPWDKQTSKQKGKSVDKPSDEYINQFRDLALDMMSNNKEVVDLNKLKVYGK